MAKEKLALAGMHDALGALRDAVKMFAPLATIGADIDKLDALVCHEAELRTEIEHKLVQKADFEAEAARRLAECDADIARRQQAQADTEKGYAKRLAALERDFTARQETLRQEAAAAEVRAKTDADRLAREVDKVRQAAGAEHQKVIAEHNAFLADTKKQRADLEAKTQALEDKLTRVRAEIAPLMAQG